jgi:hypothetical protein
MNFTYMTRIAAVLILILGILQVLLGLTIAIGWLEPSPAALKRFGASSDYMLGGVINKGIYMLLTSLVLGTLSEISHSARKWGR